MSKYYFFFREFQQDLLKLLCFISKYEGAGPFQKDVL